MGKDLLSSGIAMDVIEARIIDDHQLPCPEDVVGQITLRGVTLFDGYLELPEVTAEAFAHGWFMTGDIGFVHAWELFVLGRKTDLISVAGRKFYANDIKHLVNEVSGVKAGRVVAFGIDSEERGTQELVVLVESDEYANPARVQQIRKEIKRRVLGALDCAVEFTRVLAPQVLVKTTSGKIARQANRRWFLDQQRLSQFEGAAG